MINAFEELQDMVKKHHQAIQDIAARLLALEEIVGQAQTALKDTYETNDNELAQAKESLDKIESSIRALAAIVPEKAAAAEKSKRAYHHKQASKTNSVTKFRNFLAGYQVNELNLKDVPKEAITYWSAQKVQLQIAGFKKVPGIRGLWRRGP